MGDAGADPASGGGFDARRRALFAGRGDRLRPRCPPPGSGSGRPSASPGTSRKRKGAGLAGPLFELCRSA